MKIVGLAHLGGKHVAFLSDSTFWIGLLSVIWLDLILAGDNAIVIALAARNVPKNQQKQVIWLGTAGAIVIRIAATLILVRLLEKGIPGLLFAGGLMLLWISYKLLTDDSEHDHIAPKESMMAAVRTIIVADAAMGLDNVLAIAGTANKSGAHGPLLVVLGLLISVPIVIWGSTLFIKLIERFAWVLYLGAAVLAYTAAEMIIGEEFGSLGEKWPALNFHHFFEANPVMKYVLIAILIVVIVGFGKRAEIKKAASSVDKAA
jgi:YjbE family integral membrane protein